MSATLTMMHIAYAGPHAAKRMSRDGNVALKTAEKWWQWLTTPRADVLLRLAHENQALRELMMKALMGELDVDAISDVERGAHSAESAVALDAILPDAQSSGGSARIDREEARCAEDRRVTR